jgi:hypothetical protein
MAVYGPVHKLPYDPMYYALVVNYCAGVIIVAWDIIRKWNIVLQS